MPTFEQVKQQQYADDLLPKGARVLIGRTGLKIDLGCGSGRTPNHIGFDCMPGSDADYICDLNEGIPLEDDSCINIVAGHFLEHVEDPEWMIYEMWRVCHPTGEVRINVPAVSWDSVFAVEHKHILSEHFFRCNRPFWSLFRLTGLCYQVDSQALYRLRKYLPTITADDAGEMFCNIRRQLLVRAVPKCKENGVGSLEANDNFAFPLGPTIGTPHQPIDLPEEVRDETVH